MRGQTMDKLLESHPEFTALKYVGRTSEEVTAVMNALRDNSSVTALYELEVLLCVSVYRWRCCVFVYSAAGAVCLCLALQALCVCI